MVIKQKKKLLQICIKSGSDKSNNIFDKYHHLLFSSIPAFLTAKVIFYFHLSHINESVLCLCR